MAKAPRSPRMTAAPDPPTISAAALARIPCDVGMNGWHWLVMSLTRLLARSALSWQCEGSHHIPLTGPVILAMNHQSYLDPPLMSLASPRQDFVYLAKRELMAWPIAGKIFPRLHVIPVDQENADRTALRHMLNILRAGHAAIIFPEGGRTEDGRLQPAQPGLGLVAAKTLAPVVPMRIFGAYNAYPIHGRLRAHPVAIRVGESIQFTAADFPPREKDAYQRASERVMNAIRALTWPGFSDADQGVPATAASEERGRDLPQAAVFP